ncbi:MAG: hypothetical protein H7099_00695, partial [Gemmatimonadaceae bacterium]|nr:hypothetical protein [Gemmatimonadaceae bacterium]
MHNVRQATGSQVGTPAPARSASALDAENARLDAQLEVAAKKAALAGMERAAAGQSPDAPPAIAGADVA